MIRPALEVSTKRVSIAVWTKRVAVAAIDKEEA
jgi:hypothetical protein